MRKLLIIGVLVLLTDLLLGQNLTTVYTSSCAEESSFLWENNLLKGKLIISEVEIFKNEEDEIELILPAYHRDGIPGSPYIPVLSKMIEYLPGEGSIVSTRVLDSVLIDLDVYFPNCKLTPVQASKIRTQGVLHEKTPPLDEIYNSENWYSLPTLRIDYEGNMRGVSLGRLQISPFKYHPQSNQLIVYTVLEFVIEAESLASSSEKRDQFNSVFDHILLKDEEQMKKKLVVEKPISMIVLSDTTFKSTLQPYIQWKIEKGMDIIEVYVNDLAMGTDFLIIKDTLKSLYLNPPEGISAPSYLLIVGENSIIPLSESEDQDTYVTDLYYTTFDSVLYTSTDTVSDYLPELFYGRISVKNSEELEIVLNKLMQYEKYNLPDPAYLNKSVLVAGNDGNSYVYGNGHLNYAAKYYLNKEQGIHADIFLHPEASSQDVEIRSLISSGVGFVNYTGHGSSSGWEDPSFNTSHVSQLQANEKYSFYITNACQTNHFSYSSNCFGEALLKADKRGAIGYIGCANDSYWDEDFYWAVGVGSDLTHIFYDSTSNGFYDKAFHKHGELVENWAPSMGEMIFAGNMAVQGSETDLKRYYWEIYQLMGDPSVVPWFKEPEESDVTFPSEIQEGESSMHISASAYDYCALSYNGVLLDAKHADEFGEVDISFPDSVWNKDLLLVVTGDNREPFIRMIPEQGYLELLDIRYASESVKQDGLISNGESFKTNLLLLNKGMNETGEFDLLLRSESTDIEILDSVCTVNSILAGDSIRLADVFSVKAGQDISDFSPMKIIFQRVGDQTANKLMFADEMHTPHFESSKIKWDDRYFGNGNGVIDFGEKIKFDWTFTNTGSYESEELRIFRDSVFRDSILTDFLCSDFMEVMPGEERVLSFSGVIKNDSKSQYAGPFILSDSNYFISDSIYLSPGILMADFSNQSSERFPWLEMDWYLDDESYMSYPAAMRSGNIGDSDTSVMSIQFRLLESDSISFDYLVSSENGYDFLSFQIDTAKVLEVSGYSEWENITFQLDTGIHVLKWVYLKDNSVSRGEDAAWIDNIHFPRDAFNRKELALMKVLSPVDGPFLSNDEEFTVLLSNLGVETLDSFNIAFQLDTLERYIQQYKTTLMPNESVEVTIPAQLDLAKLLTYNLNVAVYAEGDGYPGNDSLNHSINHYIYPDLSVEEVGADSLINDYVDLVVRLENRGNVALEKWEYDLRIDEQLKGTFERTINLDPDQWVEETVRLLDHLDGGFDKGWHAYDLTSAPDSLLANNMLSGEVYWNVTSLTESSVESLGLFPNPVENEFYLELPDGMHYPCMMSIYDIEGKLIYESKLYGEDTSYKSSKIFTSEGMYIVKISQSNRELEMKIEVR